MNIGKNTFYKRYDITTEGLVELHAQYKDVPIQNTDNNFKIEGKANANRYVVSGQVASEPPQGSAELTTGSLNLYVSGTSLSSTTTLPQLSLYKIKGNDITTKEGGFTLAAVGDNAEIDEERPATPGQTQVYTTYVGNGIAYLTEDFSGKELGQDIYSSSLGGNIFAQAEPYLDPLDEETTQALFIGGTQSWLASGDLDDLSSNQVLQKYFSNPDPNNPGGFRMPIKPKNKSKPEGLWKNKIDLRKEMEYYTIYPPFWRWDHIKSLVKYGRSYTVPSPPADEGGSEVEPSKNNTIFKDLYRTPNNSNAAESGKDENNAWAVSDMKISTSKAKTGGSSLKLYHLWNFSKDNPASDKLFGDAGGSNSQFTCAYLDCIPYPVPMDHTFSSDYNSVAAASGSANMNLVKPEINMTFSVTQLNNNVRWYNRLTQSDTASGSSWTIADADKFMKFKGYCSGSVQEFAMNDHAWSGGNIGAGPLADNVDPRLGGAGYKTLLRNFTVTLSNYPPVKGESLDTFLDRGMSSFYSGTNNSIVGGFTISRTVNEDTNQEGYVGPKLTAQPLLTRPSHWIASGNSGAGWTGGYLSRGLPFFATSGAQGTGATANLFINGAAYVGWDASGPSDGNPAQYYESSVELPMDDFVDVKIMFDTSAENGWGFGGEDFMLPTQAGRTSHAEMCKAYFMTPTTSGNMTATGDPSTTLDKVPSIPIYFPAVSGSTKVWNWTESPERWPHIMTVWLTNYRFYSDDETNFSSGSSWTGATASSGLTTGTTEGGSGTDDDPTFYVTKAGYGLGRDFPVAQAGSGNSKAAEAFIDRIELNNFGTEVFNNSSAMGVMTLPIGIKNNHIRSPMGDRTSGSMGPANERGDEFYKRIAPTYVTIGFDNVATLPSVNGNQRYAWLMWNGFSQANFKPNLQNDTSTLQAWKSMVSGSSGVTAAEAKFVNYYGGQCMQVGNLNLGTANPAAAVTAGYQTPACKQGINVSFGAATGNGSEVDYLHFQTGVNSVLSCDGLSQKGTSYMSIKTTDWMKRENILVSSRVLDVPSLSDKSTKTHDYDGESWDIPQNSIVVTNPGLFETGDATNGPFYMMWVQGTAGASDAEMTNSAAVTGKRSAHLTVKEKNDALITFNEPLPAIATDDLLPRLLIGPVKYWITMQAFNGPKNSGGGVGSIQTYISGTKGGDKAYDNIAILGTLSGSTTTPAETMTGSTYNESTYFYSTSLEATGGRSGTYGRKWILDADPEGNLELETDYGYGAYDEEKREGGQLDIKTAYVGEMLHLNLKGLVDNGEEPNDDFKVVLGLKSPMAQHKVEITSPDTDIAAIDKAILKPHFLWGYKDEVPKVSNLSVGPLFNMLEEETNLYEVTNQDLRAVKFTWEEDADDIWYRMLMIDVSGNTIKNKYHGAKFVIKGNEAPATPAAKPTTYVYDYTVTPPTKTSLTAGGSGDSVGSDVRSVVTGLQGYAIKTSAPVNATGQAGASTTITLASTASSTNDFYNGYQIQIVGGAGAGADNDRVITDYVGSTKVATVAAWDGSLGNPDNTSVYCIAPTGTITIGSGTNTCLDGMGEFTIVLHVVPAAADATRSAYLFTYGDDDPGTDDAVYCYIHTDGTIKFVVDGNTLQSTTKVAYDGETPMSIILTYNQSATDGKKSKLYIDGILEDTKNNPGSGPAVNGNTVIGGQNIADAHSATNYQGTIEEVIVYNKAYEIPDKSAEYIFKAANVDDSYGNSVDKKIGTQDFLVHTAKLFAYDYTNIRGTTVQEVGSSKQVGWKVTSV